MVCLKEWMLNPLFQFVRQERGYTLNRRETVEQRTAALLEPILEQNKAELVEVEFVKEGSDQILRVYIDKDGGVRIDDCEKVSRALSDALDREDFIDDAYMLEVSSPGLLRPFKKDRDFERNLGEEVEIHLFKPQEGEKDYIGALKAFDKNTVTLLFEDDVEASFERSNISMIRKYIDFSDL